MDAAIELPALDADGYLINPEEWNAGVAEVLAHGIGLELGDDHWDVIRFMRRLYEERQVAPDARHVIKHLDERYPNEGRKRLFELFPYGYPAQACKVAGMKRPRAWSTG